MLVAALHKTGAHSHFIVDDEAHVLDIEPARRHVGRDQDGRTPRLEVGEHALSTAGRTP